MNLNKFLLSRYVIMDCILDYILFYIRFVNRKKSSYIHVFILLTIFFSFTSCFILPTFEFKFCVFKLGFKSVSNASV